MTKSRDVSSDKMQGPVAGEAARGTVGASSPPPADAAGSAALLLRLRHLCRMAGIEAGATVEETIAAIAGDPERILRFFSAWVLSDWLRFEAKAVAKDAMRMLFDVAALRMKSDRGGGEDAQGILNRLLYGTDAKEPSDYEDDIPADVALDRVRLTPAGAQYLSGVDDQLESELRESDALEEPFALDGGDALGGTDADDDEPGEAI